MSKALSMAILLLFCSVAGSVAQEKYIASYAGFAGFQAPLWAATDFGFMTKYAVNTDLVMIPGSAVGICLPVGLGQRISTRNVPACGPRSLGISYLPSANSADACGLSVPGCA